MSDRWLGWLIAVAVVAVIGTLVARSYFKEASPTPVVGPGSREIETKPTRTAVRVQVTRCKRESEFGRTVMEGYVQNSGNVDLHYVTVQSIWKNQAGLVVATDTLYAVNGTDLPPGAQRTFTDSSDLSSVARCNAEALDWW